MMKKTYILCVMMSLCLWAEAQKTGRLISASFKVGPIFISRPPDVDFGIHGEQYHKCNVELNIEENKFGIGLTARYIANKIIENYGIRNPFFQPPKQINRATLQVGDIVYRTQNLSNFSFMLNKRLLLVKNKHRIDFALGTQFRNGSVGYFQEFFGWEILTDEEYLDKYGFMSRLGYTYMMSNHISLSTNVEYAKFRKEPSDFFDFNVLVGIRF